MSLEEKYTATLKGIADAWDGMPKGIKLVALKYLRDYARTHKSFTGGDVLAAFREEGIPGSELDWRNRWGAIISEGHRARWYVKDGRAVPTTKQSHTESLVKWKSRLYKAGPDG